MAVAPSALSHLESACHLFERVSDRTRTAKILPILLKLKERAHEALTTHEPYIPNSATGYTPKVKTEVDELAALGGGTRLVTRKTTSSSSTSSHSDPTSLPASPSPPVAESPQSWLGYDQMQQQDYNYPHYSLASGPRQSYGSPPMTMQTVPEYYSYTPVAYPSPDEMANVPMPDLNYSWQNFVEQFKG